MSFEKLAHSGRKQERGARAERLGLGGGARGTDAHSGRKQLMSGRRKKKGGQGRGSVRKPANEWEPKAGGKWAKSMSREWGSGGARRLAISESRGRRGAEWDGDGEQVCG
jgi:hypothetical protein